MGWIVAQKSSSVDIRYKHRLEVTSCYVYGDHRIIMMLLRTCSSIDGSIKLRSKSVQGGYGRLG